MQINLINIIYIGASNIFAVSQHMYEYNEFPPLKYFLRVLKSCPKSALLYLQVWKKRGKLMHFTVHKEEVRKHFLISPTMFRNLLAPLMLINLLYSVETADGTWQIDILGPIND